MTEPSHLRWRIGDPDRDQEQFDETHFVLRLDDPPPFVVGVSDPATDWPRFQPGPLHGNTGYRSATTRVSFDLDEPCPARLHLDVYAGHGPTPALDVTINGHVGRVHLDPVREARVDLNGPPTLVAGWARVAVPVPAARLRRGTNEVAFTTVQPEPVAPEELRPTQVRHFNWFGSGIAWGGVAWEDVSDLTAPATVEVTPTPLFVDQDGELHELVHVTVDVLHGFADGTIDLEVGGHTVAARLDPGGREFGQWRVAVPVPAWEGEVDGRVRVTLDGDVAVDRRVALQSCRRWTLHLLPHVHLDLGYTDHAAKVMELHSRNLDRAVDILRGTPDWAFTVDGTMILDDYLATRQPDAVADVVAALRSGRLGLNAFSMLFLTGVASLEECYRAAYASRRLGEAHDVPVDVAHLTDVPSYSHAIPSLLHDLGITRFVGIQNHGRAATVESDELHLRSPFRWVGPDGHEVVTFFADAYAQLRFLFGDPVTVAGGSAILPRLLARFDRPDYLPTDFPIVGSHSDNEDVADGYADVVDRWNAAYAFPRLRFSTFTDYFDAIDDVADDLPAVTGDGGSYWEDGVGAHARAMAAYRQAQEALPVVESLSALTAARAPELRIDRDGLDQAWEALLFGCEHTWSSAHAVRNHHSHDTQQMTDWKVHQIDHAAHLARDAGRRAMSQLGELVTTDGPGVVVFNALPWDRRVEVEVELLVGESVVDEHGDRVAVDLVRYRDEVRVARLRVDVPAFGYRVLPVAFGRGEEPTPFSSLADDEPLVVGDWELVVRGGRIVRLRHGERDIVDQGSPWGLAEVLHVRAGGTAEGRGLNAERTTISDVGPRLPAPELDARSVDIDTVTVRYTPWGAVVGLAGSGRTLPEVVVEVHLRRDDDRVDVVVELDKEAELAKESVYVAFPFAVDDATLRYDRQVGWVDPATDHQAGACNEWFTTLHGVRVGDIAWCSADAPLFAVGEPVAGRWPTAPSRSGTLLSWPMNNHWWTNYPAAQEGRVRLRYAFRAGVTSDGDAARFGREVRGGTLVSTMVFQDKTDREPRDLPAGEGRLLDVDASWQGVDLRLMGARDDPASVIVRVTELDGRPRTLAVDGIRGLTLTSVCDALERDLAPVDADRPVPLAAWEVLTLRGTLT